MSVIPDTSAFAGSRKVHMKIDMTSDIICPFCLIGMKQLLAAIDKFRVLHPEVQFEATIRLLPFQIHPTLTDAPEPCQAVQERKFGKARATEIVAMIDHKLRALGTRPSRNVLISSTHLAHRLQTYALLHYPSRQLDLAMDLFLSYQQDGIPPNHRLTLARLAVKHGVFVTREGALAFLGGNNCDAEVRRAYVTARMLGVTGVPFFVFQDRYAASGAIGVDEFMRIFEETLPWSEPLSSLH